MSSSTLAFFLKGIGVLLMLHAAYSCMHYRSILQDLDLVLASTASDVGTDRDKDTPGEVAGEATTVMIPPVDVYIEVVVAFAMIFFGELIGIGPLQSVELSNNDKRKPLAAPAYRTRDFDIYNNRSKALSYRVSKQE